MMERRNGRARARSVEEKNDNTKYCCRTGPRGVLVMAKQKGDAGDGESVEVFV